MAAVARGTHLPVHTVGYEASWHRAPVPMDHTKLHAVPTCAEIERKLEQEAQSIGRQLLALIQDPANTPAARPSQSWTPPRGSPQATCPVGRSKERRNCDSPTSSHTTASSGTGASADTSFSVPSSPNSVGCDFAMQADQETLQPLMARQESEQRNMLSGVPPAAPGPNDSAVLLEMLKFVELEPRCLMESVRHIVQQGWSNITWAKQYTALHLAAELGRADAVPLLFALRGDPETKDTRGRTPLQVAESCRNWDCAEALEALAEKPPRNAVQEMAALVDTGNAQLTQMVTRVATEGWASASQGGLLPLHLAAAMGRTDVLVLLLAFGCPWDAVDHQGRSAMDIACATQHWDCACFLMGDTSVWSGELPDAWAMQRVQQQQQQDLLMQQQLWSVLGGSNIGDTCSSVDPAQHPGIPGGASALRVLATFIQLEPPTLREAVQHVAREGWNTITWAKGYTALHLAAGLGRSEAIPLLLALNADPGAVDRRGRTALDVAQDCGHTECAQLLTSVCSENPPARRSALQEMAQLVDVRNDRLTGAVRHIAMHGWGAAVWRDQTALHLAASLGRADVVALLIALGGNPQERDSMGRTAADVAMEKQHMECLRMMAR